MEEVSTNLVWCPTVVAAARRWWPPFMAVSPQLRPGFRRNLLPRAAETTRAICTVDCCFDPSSFLRSTLTVDCQVECYFFYLMRVHPVIPVLVFFLFISPWTVWYLWICWTHFQRASTQYISWSAEVKLLSCGCVVPCFLVYEWSYNE